MLNLCMTVREMLCSFGGSLLVLSLGNWASAMEIYHSTIYPICLMQALVGIDGFLGDDIAFRILDSCNFNCNLRIYFKLFQLLFHVAIPRNKL